MRARLRLLRHGWPTSGAKDEREPFSSTILPRYLRKLLARSPSLHRVLHISDPRGGPRDSRRRRTSLPLDREATQPDPVRFDDCDDPIGEFPRRQRPDAHDGCVPLLERVTDTIKHVLRLTS